MKALGSAYTKQRLHVDFAGLKQNCPKGVYVAPLPDDPLTWTGVLFVRKGPYANAILRFQIDFPDAYPDLPPIVTILNDVFHPLVTPLTTYSYSTRDTGAETVSAADGYYTLPPGGLSLRHGFPEWFGNARDEVRGNKEDARATRGGQQQSDGSDAALEGDFRIPEVKESQSQQPPLTLEVLLYIRVVFSTEALIDTVPLEAAANTSAWHAWRSYRSRTAAAAAAATTTPSVTSSTNDPSALRARSISPTQQPGGARRPGEWNWQGVWEDRVRKSVNASISEHMLFGGEGGGVIAFEKMDKEAVEEILPDMVGSVSL